MRKVIPMMMICLLTFFNENLAQSTTEKSNTENTPTTSVASDKIKVLNFATFHMGNTTDATSVEFDETNKKNQDDAKKIAEMISKFKPTIICVERPMEEQAKLNAEYQKYLNNPKQLSTVYTGEIGLVAFEVGRIAKVNQLHGIDHEMSYNYNIASEIKNAIDPTTIQSFYTNPFKSYPNLNVNQDELSLLDRLTIGNSQEFLDFLILINADMLALVGTENGFEGADEAAKYYQRNLRIYSNLNRIPATKEDRIFILSGGSHTAFLGEFMKRSPKYEMVNTLDYLD